jgi:hypothetical protein
VTWEIKLTSCHDQDQKTSTYSFAKREISEKQPLKVKKCSYMDMVNRIFKKKRKNSKEM